MPDPVNTQGAGPAQTARAAPAQPTIDAAQALLDALQASPVHGAVTVPAAALQQLAQAVVALASSVQAGQSTAAAPAPAPSAAPKLSATLRIHSAQVSTHGQLADCESMASIARTKAADLGLRVKVSVGTPALYSAYAMTVTGEGPKDLMDKLKAELTSLAARYSGALKVAAYDLV